MTQAPPLLPLADARRAARVMSSCGRPEAVRLNRQFGLPYLHLGNDRYARLPDVIRTLGMDVALTLYTDRRGLLGWRAFAVHSGVMVVILTAATDPHPALPEAPVTYAKLRELAEHTERLYQARPPVTPWQVTADRAARLTLRYFPALTSLDERPDARIDADDATWLLRTLPVVCAVSHPALVDQPDVNALRTLLHSALGAPLNVIDRTLRSASALPGETAP